MSREGSNPSPSLKDLKEVETMKKIVLDESILDIDKWLPQDAIDQMVEIILQIETIENWGMNMTLVQRMDELIQKLESNDEAFIEQLNADFEKYCENKLSRKRH